MNVLKPVVIPVFGGHQPHIYAHSIPIPENFNFLGCDSLTINLEHRIRDSLHSETTTLHSNGVGSRHK